MLSAPLTMLVSTVDDFANDERDEANRYLDTDYVPRQLSIPGFLRAERYELAKLPFSEHNVHLKGATRSHPPRYFNVFYIAGPNVVTSEAYERHAALASVRARRAFPRAEHDLRSEVWIKRWSPWVRGRTLAAREGPKTLHIIALAVEPGWEQEYNEFEDHIHVPQRLSCPGFLSCERFERAKPLTTNIGVSTFTYLTVYHTESSETSNSPQYREQSAVRGELSDRLSGRYGPRWRGVYMQRPSPWTVRPTFVG